MKKTLLITAFSLIAVTTFAGDGPVRRSPQRIPGRYIVVLAADADASSVADTVRKGKGAQIHHQYEHGVKGLAVEMSDADAEQLARDPRVDYIEEDSEISSSVVPWGPDRIDQRNLPLNGSYAPGRIGKGVRAYVIDSGVSPHDEFGGRLVPGFSAISDGFGTRDCNGHGTHVAGILGGKNYGVAEGTSIVPVRVLDCGGKGSLSTLLKGIEFVTVDRLMLGRPSVANMSLTGYPSSTLDTAVNYLISAGVTTVAAAGNNGDDACKYSPARVPGVLTVGATNSTDQRATWSNYGTCVDLFAPGTGILSAWYTTTKTTATLSGTSQASPFVAGVAALWLEKDPGASPATVALDILSHATTDLVADAGTGTPNRFLCALFTDATIVTPVTQLISDSGFDNGTSFWSTDICTVINQSGCPPEDVQTMSIASNLPSRSGSTHASLGGRNRDVQVLSAPITVPSNANTVELSFWLWVVTAEHKSTAEDVLKVEIRDASGALLETVGSFSNLDESSTYVLHKIDMTRYRGKTIRISFASTPDQGAPTWFLLDDVDLSAW